METNKPSKIIKPKITRKICDGDYYDLDKSDLVDKSKSLWKIIVNKMIKLDNKNIN
jgi:hypothetical protein